ncbi:MAG: glycosyltransferase [Planctomycetota bacterium]
MKFLCTTFDSAYPARTDASRRLGIAVNALREQGHHVIVAEAAPGSVAGGRQAALGWSVRLEPVVFDGDPGVATALALKKNFRALTKIIKATGPDVVLAHDLASAHCALRAVDETEFGEVVVDFSGGRLSRAGGNELLFSPLWLRFWEQREIRVVRSDARVLTSSTALRDALAALGRAPQQVRVIGDGVNAKVFARDPFRRMRPKAALDNEAIVAIHGLCRTDHAHVIVAAAKQVVERRPEVKFWVLASPVVEEVRRLTVYANLSGSFHFAPWDHPDSLSASLGSADLAIVAPLGGTHAEERLDPHVLEAAACELPVVIPATEANRELEQRLPHLKLYRQGSAEAISRSVLDLLQVERRLTLMGRELRERIEDTCTQQRLAQAFVSELVQLPVAAPRRLRTMQASPA